MSRQDYSIAQIAALVLLCGELYMRAHSPASPKSDPTRQRVKVRNRKCRDCQKVFESYAEDTCEPCRFKKQAPVVHADVLERLKLAGGDWESLAISLADLDVAMRMLGQRSRDGISEFVALGPLSLEADYVEFRYGHRAHLLALYRAMNRKGEFSFEVAGANAA